MQTWTLIFTASYGAIGVKNVDQPLASMGNRMTLACIHFIGFNWDFMWLTILCWGLVFWTWTWDWWCEHVPVHLTICLAEQTFWYWDTSGPRIKSYGAIGVKNVDQPLASMGNRMTLACIHFIGFNWDFMWLTILCWGLVFWTWTWDWWCEHVPVHLTICLAEQTFWYWDTSGPRIKSSAT